MDAVKVLLDNQRDVRKDILKKRFSFKWLARRIIARQDLSKDCIMLVTGDRRQGKSNWSLKLIRAYIRERKKRDPGFTWSWKKNFPLSRTAAIKAAATLPDRSFIVYDEGGDQFYRQETNKKAQRDLIKFMYKSGIKRHLTIIVWPDPYTLDPKLLNMAQLLVIVPYRAGNVCSFAFIYGRSNNPLNYDKFGIERIRKKFMTTKGNVRAMLPSMDGILKIYENNKQIEVIYPKALFKFLRTIPTFLKSHRFNRVDKRFEDAYISNVKSKLLETRRDDDYINIVQYERLKDQYEILIYNLYKKDDKSYAQLERLHISPKDGTHLKSITAIRAMVNSVEAKT